MKCLKIFIVATVRIYKIFSDENWKWKLERRNIMRRKEYNEKKKENAKDVKSRYHKQRR